MMPSVRFSKLIQYGLIAFPLAFAGLPIYLHAPDFYATQLNIPIEMIGGALLLLRFFDALQDPLIGGFSDQFYQYRKSIISVGAIMLIGGMWMIFHPPQTFILFWLCLSIFICTTGFSIVSINVQALGGLWTVKATEVTHVMAAREALGLCGLLVAAITPPLLLHFYHAETVFHYLTLGFIPLMLVCVWVFLYWMQSVPISKPKRDLPLSFKDVFSGTQKRYFFSGYFLSTIASSIPATLIIFYVRDYLQAENYLGLFLLIYFLSGAAAMPLWIKIAQRKSTLMSWWISMVLACLTFIWAFFINPGNILVYALLCLASGIAVGANLTLPSAIVADILSQDSHQKAASRYYAFMAFLAKASLALATGITLPLLGVLGYQPGEITTGLLMPTAYAIIPCCLQLLAIAILWRLIQLQTRQTLIKSKAV